MTGSTIVRLLRDVRMADAAEIGRKAASLGELLAAGFRVPDGVVLTAGTATYRRTTADRCCASRRLRRREARLRTGMRVTVDGGTGNVEPA